MCVCLCAQTDAYTEKSLTRLENSRLVCKLHDRQKIALCEKRGEEEEEERSDLEEKSQTRRAKKIIPYKAEDKKE